jgi:hypothetical protein
MTAIWPNRSIPQKARSAAAKAIVPGGNAARTNSRPISERRVLNGVMVLPRHKRNVQMAMITRKIQMSGHLECRAGSQMVHYQSGRGLARSRICCIASRFAWS